MSVVRELVAVLGIKLDENEFKGAEAALGGLKSAMLAIGAVAGAGLGLVALVRHTADLGRETEVLADRFGVSAETFQELKYVGERFRLSLASMEIGLRNFELAAVRSTKGNKRLAKAFADAGVKVKDSSGKFKPTVSLMREIADVMAKAKSPTERSALAIELFGRAGEKFVPILKGGSAELDKWLKRAHDLGLVIDDETIKSLDALKSQFDEVEASVVNLGRQFAFGLVPTFRDILDGVIKWRIENRALIEQGIKAASKWVARFVVVGGEMVLMLAEASLSFARLLVWLEKNSGFVKLLGTALIPLLIARLYSMGTALVGLTRFIIAFNVGLLPAIASMFAFVAIAGIAAAVIDDLNHYLDGSRSLMGEFFHEFLDKPPDANEHWVITIIRAIMSALRTAIETGEDFGATIADALAPPGLPGASAKEQLARKRAQRRTADLARDAQKDVARDADASIGKFLSPLRGSPFGLPDGMTPLFDVQRTLQQIERAPLVPFTPRSVERGPFSQPAIQEKTLTTTSGQTNDLTTYRQPIKMDLTIDIQKMQDEPEKEAAKLAEMIRSQIDQWVDVMALQMPPTGQTQR